MQTFQQIRQIRIEKIKKLQAMGVEAYPYNYERTHFSTDIISGHTELESSEKLVSAAGRLMSIRGHGKSSFAHLHDAKGKIQIYVRKDKIGDRQFDIYGLLDIGDHVGVRGKVFTTRTGEVSIHVEELTFLSKAIRPLPIVKEKETEDGTQVFDQFLDKEQRYRRRYVDLIVNPDVRDVFIARSRIISTMRTYLQDKEYLEVETPILQQVYGGAFARPFTTHLNVLDMDLFLRISDELYLKRLIVGGFERVFEFGKDFRNEGMDRFHNPEFTILELYAAYEDYFSMMELVEEMVSLTAQKITGSTTVRFKDNEINFAPPWQRITYYEGIKKFTGKDVDTMDVQQLRVLAKEQEIEPEDFWGAGKLIEEIFDRAVEPNLVQPTFVVDYPLEISPLAKRHRKNPDLVERFEAIVAGKEICNAFSELNDPLDQLERFKFQSEMREKGDVEAQMPDNDYIDALEYGMPPTGGLGIGIDRLVMLLTNSESIRDVLLFPQMKPLSEHESDPEKTEET